MKKILCFFILLVFCGTNNINASVEFSGAFNISGRVNNNSNLILDVTPTASVAYSLRKLRNSYTGPLIRVRRSLDNAEQDIYANDLGYLDTVNLLTFVGSNIGYVTTWYDQSLNGKNALQVTAAKQPRICNGGSVYTKNSKPSIYGPSNTFFDISQTITSNVLFFVLVSSIESGSANYSRLISAGQPATYDGLDIRYFYFGRWATNQSSELTRYASIRSNITYGNLFTSSGYFQTSGAFSLQIDQTLSSNSYTSGNFNIAVIRLNDDLLDSARLIGYYSEFIIWANDSGSYRNILHNDCKSYYGTP